MTIPEAAKLMEKCCAVCLDPGSFEEDEEGEQVLEAMLTALKSLGGFKANLTRLKTTAVWTEQGPQNDEEKEQWWEVFVSWLSRQDIPLSEVAKQRVGIPGLGTPPLAQILGGTPLMSTNAASADIVPDPDHQLPLRG